MSRAGSCQKAINQAGVIRTRRAAGLQQVNISPSGADHEFELAIVIPTYNERENICPLVAALERALAAIEWQAIFVDDGSPDGTAQVVRDLAQTNHRVRLVERIGRRGLSSACIEGISSTAAPFVAVMDADLQHDESILPEMLARMKAARYDVVVASRRIQGGSVGEFAAARNLLSSLGGKMSRFVSCTRISDPMSGFFLVDRSFFRQVVGDLSGAGFKILLDLLASSKRPVRIDEVPYRFRRRHAGHSKFGVRIGLEYLRLIFEKLAVRVIPGFVSREEQRSELVASQSL